MKELSLKDDLHLRLKKAIGQVQAVDRMIEEDAPCADILTQISAAKAALNRAGQIVLKDYVLRRMQQGEEGAQEDIEKAIARFAGMQ